MQVVFLLLRTSEDKHMDGIFASLLQAKETGVKLNDAEFLKNAPIIGEKRTKRVKVTQSIECQ